MYMIDTCTRYTVAAALDEELELCQQVIDKFAELWVSIFGCPKKIVSDHEVISSKEFKFMAMSAGINVHSDDAEATGSNKICEQQNRVLGDRINIIRSEVNCSLPVALTWAINYLNSVLNIQGFSPSQLVFGLNLILPSVSDGKPPFLSDEGYSKLIRKHLYTQQISRKSFVQANYSATMRRTLNFTVSTSGDTIYINGDKVRYKRAGDKEFRGPGVIVGQDDQCVLIIHQASWVRVHPCRLQLSREVGSPELHMNMDQDSFETSDEITVEQVPEATGIFIKIVEGDNTIDKDKVHTEVTGKQSDNDAYTTKSEGEIVEMAPISAKRLIKGSYSKGSKVIKLKVWFGPGKKLQCHINGKSVWICNSSFCNGSGMWVLKQRLKR